MLESWQRRKFQKIAKSNHEQSPTPLWVVKLDQKYLPDEIAIRLKEDDGPAYILVPKEVVPTLQQSRAQSLLERANAGLLRPLD